MNSCLLCLQVSSEKWSDQNIKDLIDVHLWPFSKTNGSSWICNICGRILNDFHEFYERIKRVQQNYWSELKHEEGTPELDEKHFLENESSDNQEDNYQDISLYKNALKESHLQQQIIMEQPLPTEFVMDDPFIKEENSSGDEKKLKQNRKRGRPTKHVSQIAVENCEDPLLKAKKTNRKIRIRKLIEKSECHRKLLHSVEDVSFIKGKNINCGSIKNSLDSKNINDSDTDPEQQDEKETHREAAKKKNHRNLDSKTLKEYDKIIAENFKIFCNLCQSELDNFLSLRKHFKIEHKQRGYARCCNRNFFTRSLLVDHIHVHLNPEYFKCHQCNKVFSDRSRLLCHKKLHEDDSKLDKCDICGKLFADKGALKKHVQTHSSEKLFPCSICGKFFTNSFILNHHIEAVHQNKFVQICDICGKSIRCPTAFASHMEKHEVRTIPTSCDVCGLLLTNKEGLKRHKNSQHPEGGKKEHTCHICSKVSPTLRALKSHIRSVHESGFDFKCSLCEKSFKRPAVLREHMATHTGTALYTCLWCPRTFISNGNMYNHRKNAHPKEWEELKRQKYAGSTQ